MPNELDYFKVGNNKILYSDVESYECKMDTNGNPKFKVTLKGGWKYEITGSQAYAFDSTRVKC